MAMISRKLGTIDALAESAATAALKPNELIENAKRSGIRTEPLDVSALARNLGISLSTGDLPDHISGYLKKESDTGRWAITVNINHHEKRQRFTIAHEIGHYILHRRRSDCFEDESSILFRNNVISPMESEANRYAADILMPESLFRSMVLGGMTRIEDLADYFNVSALSVKVRAKQLGYEGHGI